MTNDSDENKTLVPAETPSESSGGRVTLAPAEPWVTSFTVPEGKEGGTLVVTKSGTEFSAKDADRVRNAAKRHGVKIKEIKA